jgi:hypothetical protein
LSKNIALSASLGQLSALHFRLDSAVSPVNPSSGADQAVQASAQREIEQLHTRCSGDQGGPAVLQAVNLCAVHNLLMPAWLREEYVKRHHLVADAHVKSWDDAFGRPWPAGTRLSTIRRKSARLKAVHAAVWDQAKRHPEKAIRRDSIFNDVAELLDCGLSAGSVERIYYKALSMGFTNVSTWRRALTGDYSCTQDIAQSCGPVHRRNER